jgi:hypothetical protein
MQQPVLFNSERKAEEVEEEESVRARTTAARSARA